MLNINPNLKTWLYAKGSFAQHNVPRRELMLLSIITENPVLVFPILICWLAASAILAEKRLTL